MLRIFKHPRNVSRFFSKNSKRLSKNTQKLEEEVKRITIKLNEMENKKAAEKRFSSFLFKTGVFTFVLMAIFMKN